MTFRTFSWHLVITKVRGLGTQRRANKDKTAILMRDRLVFPKLFFVTIKLSSTQKLSLMERSFLFYFLSKVSLRLHFWSGSFLLEQPRRRRRRGTIDIDRCCCRRCWRRWKHLSRTKLFKIWSVLKAAILKGPIGGLWGDLAVSCLIN